MNGPWQPRRRIDPGTASHRLIRGVLRMEARELNIACVELHRTDSWRVWIVDSGDGDAWRPDGDTTMHILWQAIEDDAWVAADGQRFPIAPGDTMSVPAGTDLETAAGMLMVVVEAMGTALARAIPPSHGTETFEGYNRRTDYETPDAFTLERWKITQPLRIDPTDGPITIIDLATPLAITWAGGTDLIGRGECRVFNDSSGPVTLLPDGLGYALVVRKAPHSTRT